MKIVNLKAENFKKLTAVEITPGGNTVVITGKNGAGKSSVLDAIEVALCGGRSIPKQPIKQGESRAIIELDMGEYKVTRKFLGASSTLVVETTGDVKSKISSPQTFLDNIVGKISFDPLAFMKMSPTEQRATVLNFLGVDPTPFDNAIAALKTKRSVTLQAKEAAFHTANSIVFTPELPNEEQSSDQLLAELNSIRDENEQIQKTAAHRQLLESRLIDVETQIIEAQAALDSAKKRLDTLRESHKAINSEIDSTPSLGEVKDTSEVEKKLKNMEETNKAIRANQQQRKAIVEADNYKNIYSQLGVEIKTVEEQKAHKMAEASMPISGLTIATDGLLFGGIPLEQVNDGKKLEICVAISMALNPKLKVLRINGNDLDKDSLSALGRMVSDKDYQIWIEKVGDNKSVGFYIEDGTLNTTNGEVQNESK